ncbi:MAG: tetratricopeptide repeat protein [Alphaproteobacteria bacterium]|nr:tetratricopeptide repeat protein [Alphaproteobacteria bacterium]
MADEQDQDFDLEGGAGDYALRAEMAASEFALRHWKPIVGVLVAVVAGIFTYGQVRDWYVDGQKAASAQIASAEDELSTDVFQLALARAGIRPDATIDVPATTGVADALVEIANTTRGTAAVEAALKAAELYRLAGNDTERRAALELASAGASGVLHYAAEAALGTLDLEEGKVESAVTRFEALASGKDFLARQATLDLAGVYETLGRTSDAVATYDRWLSTWPDAPEADDVRERKERAGLGPVAAPKAPEAPPAEEGSEAGDPAEGAEEVAEPSP